MSIDLERRGAIAIVTINRPDRLNVLDESSLRELYGVLKDISLERSIRAVVLTGSGERAFVAGADIAGMQGYDSDDALVFGRLGHAVASAIEHLPQPVICAVNGFALGGGCELAIAADIRIASDNAVFAQPEVQLGIPPGWGGSQRLPRVISPGYAAEMILTGKRVDAREALRIGLVNSVHPSEGLLDAAVAIAEAIARNSPVAVRAAKRLLLAESRQNPVSGLREEAKAFAMAFDHPDQREGMTAFVEKRAPVFED
jgi:enoyl-CoA hydratase